MKTCHRFTRIRTGYEQDIQYLRSHSERHEGKPSAKASAKHAAGAKRAMARALNRHYERCPECG
ncbi:hypothetical protein OG711_07695 [Streptomyces uncialis]|uniref:hypothetical protein n=1 Tax=Streptomyces uncialis TaxID=1048205 RepID=UPI002255D388|nr:hypothetical protein [Streptomyces uncialis]MCX4659149.1 hypothetical protein [Streptomyces uncialis]WTE14067.1 hypothetical protein OG924_29880 [Streptomyces uncialis]